MADPTIQTFCCHTPVGNNTAVNLMLEFSTKSYNTVCLISSSIGIVGALYQILPREDPSLSNRWFSSAVRGRQIVVWLAVADLMASLGVFVRSALWMNHKEQIGDSDLTSVLFCAISSAWIQYFYTATWLWTLCYALDMYLVLKDREGWPVLYRITAWGTPAFLTFTGLAILYLPDANCHALDSFEEVLARILPNYCVTYIPLLLVMIACPTLYLFSSVNVKRVIACGMGQFTSKERSLVDAIRVKFAFINLAFYVCWLPNLISGILLWTLWFKLPKDVITVLWFITAAANPLQAFLNSLVYRSWSGGEKVYIPCKYFSPLSSRSPSVSSHSPLGETTPLLQSQEYEIKSINGATQDSSIISG